MENTTDVGVINEEFLRRQRQSGSLRSICWLLFIPFIVLSLMREPAWCQQLACIVIAPIAIAFAFAAHLTWKCPSCRTLLGRVRDPEKCPKCGVLLQVSEHTAD